TGLFLLSTYLNEQNVEALLSEARGKSRRQIEELIARWFPRPDVPPSIDPVVAPADAAQAELRSLLGGQERGGETGASRAGTCSGAGKSDRGAPGGVETLSHSRD